MSKRKPRVKICRRGRAHLGEIELPIEGGSITVQTLGWDPMAALKRAGTAAYNIANDPRLAPFIPPQAMMAARMVRALAKLSPDGLKEAADNTEDAATRKLALALLKKLEESPNVSGSRGVQSGRYRKQGYTLGPGSQRRKGGPRRGSGPITQGNRRPSKGYGKGGLPLNTKAYGNRLNVAPSLNPYDQAPMPDPNADPYAQAPSGMPAIDHAAQAAWGASAFDPGMFPEEDTAFADEYMDAYEDAYEDGSEDDYLEYGEQEGDPEAELVHEDQAPQADQAQPDQAQADQAQPDQAQDGGAK